MQRQMSSLERFHAMSQEQLEAQSARSLLWALGASRGRWLCDACREIGCDAEDNAENNAFNDAQERLGLACKAILATRGHVPRSTRQVKKAEKKAMAY